MNAIIFSNAFFLDAKQRRKIMKETLKKLWNEYFIDECAAIDNEEERVLIRRAGELHDGVNELLTEEQVEIFEKYVEEIYKA